MRRGLAPRTPKLPSVNAQPHRQALHNVQTADAKDGGKHLTAVATASELYCVSMKITSIIEINPLESKINMYYI